MAKKLSNKEVQALSAKWRNMMSTARQEEDDEILVKIGVHRFTRADFRDKIKYDHYPAVRRLNRIIGERFPRAKNLYDLSQRITVQDLGRIPGVGPEVIIAYGKLLLWYRINPSRGVEHYTSVAGIYASAKPVKRKSPQQLQNLVVFSARNRRTG